MGLQETKREEGGKGESVSNARDRRGGQDGAEREGFGDNSTYEKTCRAVCCLAGPPLAFAAEDQDGRIDGEGEFVLRAGDRGRRRGVSSRIRFSFSSFLQQQQGSLVRRKRDVRRRTVSWASQALDGR